MTIAAREEWIHGVGQGRMNKRINENIILFD